jgi:hypothetical protein
MSHWDLFNKTEQDAENTAGALLALGLNLTDSATGSVALQDISNLYKAFSPDYYGNVAGDPARNYYVKSQVKGYLPASGFLKSIQRGAVGGGKDPVIREVETWVDQVVAIYKPEAVKPKLNAISGEEIPNEGTYAGFRITKSALQKHPALLKMYQLQMSFNPPSEDIFGYKLSQDQHWEYQKMIHDKFNLIGTLDDLVTQEGFDNLPKDVQKKMLEKMIQNTRAMAGLEYLNAKDLFNEAINQKITDKLKGLTQSTGQLPNLQDPNAVVNILSFPYDNSGEASK